MSHVHKVKPISKPEKVELIGREGRQEEFKR